MQADAAIVHHEAVAGMGVAVEEAIAEDLGDVAVHEFARGRHRGGRRQTVQVSSVAELLDHDGRRAQAVHHVGDHDVGRAAPGVGETSHGSCLARQIHLVAEVGRNLVHDGCQPPSDAARARAPA